ncbi:MAG: ABC transporter ATP-binding protein [Deltaproteobacteria bacterium]|nr:ABC transporter ATP-binding protein [Deltaproteobacteria bacterium]TLN02263.1 MAG: ABC transporter ATP-binding protein [bacterium]
MSQDTAIKVENLTKTYYLYDSLQDHLKEIVHPLRKKYHQPFNALEGVSLEIKRGETVGIVGKNGSGKSTLLKVITGIVTPTRGTVTVNGRVSALLELGAGFNPELTGLQNVYFNGVISGMTRKEIDAKLDEILDFADIGEFVHQPVKSYSSGMFVRLAFAVAVAVEPEVLIVDEALAVGDLAFQLKCIKKLESFSAKGVTILFVSHDVNAVKKFCTRAIWLKAGKLQSVGSANDVVDRYRDFLKCCAPSDYEAARQPRVQAESVARITAVSLLDAALGDARDFCTGDDVHVSISYRLAVPTPDLVVGVAVFDMARSYLCGLNTKLDLFAPPHAAGSHTVVLRLREIKLLGGSYFIDVGLFEENTLVALDYQSRVADFRITDDSKTEGIVMLEHQWLLPSGSESYIQRSYLSEA